ncbi:zinc ABC transporter substrate-binding protein [Bifidobacterium psychraerophilum]|uniref:metal ABC transporter solute-binding protein, Zn/Mn family n=1 Tax=Bifidobacterium psychraerophilum TaxID=218140 RepID=UPI003112756F
MKRTLRDYARAAAVFAVVALVSATGACSLRGSAPETTTATPAGPVTVVASTAQWGSLVQELGGSQVKVTSILSSANADAHNFEPTSSDISKISTAQMLVVNGAGYDDWATKAVGKSSVLVSAADTVGASEGDNPHLWFSKETRKNMATEITESLSKILPSEKTYFHTQLSTWQKSETALEKRITAFAKGHNDLTYAATEAVAYYLMADLGFKDVTPEGYLRSIQSSGEAAPADLKSFRSLLDKQEADLLIDNPQTSDDASASLVEAARTAGISVIDVSEQMPQGTTTLEQWVSALITQISEDTAKSSVSAPPSASTSTVPDRSASSTK